MTEAEWLACNDPDKLLDALGRKVKPRKRRLLACACCYRIWSLVPNEPCRAAVIAAERFSDGLIDATELKRCEGAARKSFWGQRFTPAGHYALSASFEAATPYPRNVAAVPGLAAKAKRMWAAEQAGIELNDPRFDTVVGPAEAEERAQLAVLLRDVFGNPYRKAAFKPAWLTSDVLALAGGIYEEKAFDRMPILADALQDAGCGDTAILDHCRGSGAHVRGCWVVDLVLEKE